MSKFTKWGIVAFVFLGIVSAAYLLMYNKKTKEPRTTEIIKVSFATDSIGTTLLFDYAKDKNFFASYNLSVEEVITDKAAIRMLETNDVDVTVSPLNSPIQSFLNGSDVVWVNNIFMNTPDMYFVMKEEDTNKDLKLGVSRLAGFHQILGSIVTKKLGWDENKVDYIVAGPSTTRLTAFEKNTINTSFMYPGEGLAELKNKGYKIINPVELGKQAFSPLSVFTSNKKIGEKKVAIERFNEAINDLADYIVDNKEDVIKFMQNKYGISVEEATEVYDAMKEFGDASKPSKDNIDDMKNAVIKITETIQSSRNMEDFIKTDLVK